MLTKEYIADTIQFEGMESAQTKKNRNALSAAIKRLGEVEAGRLVAAFMALDHNCKKDWAAGNHMIAKLLDDGFSHNQIRQLLRVGGTRIRRITKEMAARSGDEHTDDDDVNPTDDDDEQDEAEARALRFEIKQLEARLSQRRSNKSRSLQLPWKDIAQVMEGMRHASTSDRRLLVSQLQANRRLAPFLLQWAAQHHLQAPVVTSRSTPFQLSHANIVANPTARTQTLDWLSQSVYHNMDRLYQRYHYPPNVTGRHFDGFYDFSDPDFLRVVRHQIDLPVPLEVAFPMFKEGYIDRQSFRSPSPKVMNEIRQYFQVQTLDEEARRVVSPHMWYINRKSLVSGYEDKLLFRVFFEENRVVVAGQTVYEDELIPKGKSTETKLVIMLVLERLENGHTRMRCLSLTPPKLKRDGYYSLEEEALEEGLDLSNCPEELKESKFEQHMAVKMAQGCHSIDEYFKGVFSPILV
ncbi:hypothetical protein LEN26_006314 [Aphanomyces euteiches]|nr:hypothetical protein AeMF1_009836 [Aphanomyces euteiches]KAH9136010.1 hypothetical protein LEN26_006314 [Aphanomyces euteiches]KAH9194455.1 hypothetical protein AeNC1_003569 [Aphanomyces euteiches]